MVWDVCSWSDMGPLISPDTTLTGDTYVRILTDHLHPFMSIVHSGALGQFHATPHTSRIATEWLHIWNLEEISTPSYSYGFRDSPVECMVSIPSSTTSDISRVHSTSCCGTSACSPEFYTILGRCISFFASSMYKEGLDNIKIYLK